MTSGSSTPVADAGGRWPALLEALLRGVGHALSNRAAGLLALADIPMDEHDAESLGMLPHEAERLQELLRVVKLLPSEPGAGPVALLVVDIVREASVVMALHPTGREVAWHITEDGPSQAVRVERWVLLRTVLLLMDAARERANAAGIRAVELRLSGADDGALATVALAVSGPDQSRPASDALDDPYLAMLVERLGATLATTEPISLTLPTLAAQRGR